MAETQRSERSQDFKVAIALVPGFGMLAAATLQEIFYLLNRDAGDGLRIDWDMVSLDGRPVTSSSGRVHDVDRPMDHQRTYDLVVVLSATSNYRNGEIATWLRSQARYGAALGAVTCGLWLLADAGLVGSRKCTLHWADLESFRELHPAINLVSDVYVIDEGLISCGGAGAIVDMMLAFLAGKISVNRIISVAETLILERLRAFGEPQKMPTSLRVRSRNPYVIAAVELIEADVSERNIVERTSRKLKVSSRWLQVLFKRDVGKTIKAYQAHCRVDRARRLLRATGLSIAEIAAIVGFSDSSHFSRVFTQHMDMSPSAYRTSDP